MHWLKFFLLQLASVDVEGALNMYIEKGEWQKCLDTAEQQVGSWYTLHKSRYISEHTHQGNYRHRAS